MTSKLNIRRAGPNDTAGIGKLIIDIQCQEFGFSITLEDQPDLNDIDGFYRTGGGDFWLAEAKGMIVGTIAMIDICDGQGALRKMFVSRKFRGREFGLAKDLLDTLLDHARANGFSKIFLGTAPKFLAAHRFYEKHGFVRLDGPALPARFPRMAIDERFYLLNL